MSLFLFIIIIMVSFIIVKLGAVAFEITGLTRNQAKFQSLSAFTGTGFTTKESELIVTHDQRRRIASTLMILGKTGLVTLIATLVNSISEESSSPVFYIPVLAEYIPSFLTPYINLIIIIVALLIVYAILANTKLSESLMKKAKQKMVDNNIVKQVSFEEFLLSSEGYGVSQIEICEDNPLLNKSLADSKLKQRGILVLSIERDGSYLTNPAADRKIKLRDKLVCFGKLDTMRNATCSPEEINAAEIVD